jgi:hypothetical protein
MAVLERYLADPPFATGDPETGGSRGYNTRMDVKIVAPSVGAFIWATMHMSYRANSRMRIPPYGIPGLVGTTRGGEFHHWGGSMDNVFVTHVDQSLITLMDTAGMPMEHVPERVLRSIWPAFLGFVDHTATTEVTVVDVNTLDGPVLTRRRFGWDTQFEPVDV